MTLSELREAFPHTGRRTYLNHAATAPLSRPVREALEARIEARQDAAINDYPSFQKLVEQTRDRAARLLGTEAGRIGFVPSTSYGLNLAAAGLDWEPGDRIAVPGCEFPANVFPFKRLEDRGVEVDLIPHESGCFTPEDVRKTLRPRTRLCSVSWVQFLSGFRADLAEIGALCRERDVLFVVDAIQGLGALEIDVETAGIDVLAAGTHKWLMGTQGLGLLYLRDGLLERLRPPMAGWAHGPIDWDRLFEYELAFRDEVSRYEIGTPNEMGLTALHAALGLYREAGPAWCEERVLDLAGYLAGGLVELGHEPYGPRTPRSGIVAVDHPEAVSVQESLADRGIEVAVRNELLRISPTYYNTRAEITRLLEGVEAYYDRTGR